MAHYRAEERKKIGWYGDHRRSVNKTIKTQANAIILGDSLAFGLSRYPSVCDLLTKQNKIVNCGSSGDCIQHVMWKIEHFSIPASLRCVVLVCGVNNMDDDKSENIALGVMFCASRLRELHPQLHVFVAAILPRDLHITTRRVKIQQTNELTKSLCLCKPGISFIEESGLWVDDCGRLNEMLYHSDYLHLIKAGNEIFAGQLVSAISPIVGEEPKVREGMIRKRPPLVSYRHKTPPSHLPPPHPISHPLQSPPCTFSSPLPP